jgi:GT2 family glycosyltransferase
MPEEMLELDPLLSLPGLIGSEINPRNALLAGVPDDSLADKLDFLGIEPWMLGGQGEGRRLTGSLREPFGRHFDLVVVLDGLGELTPQEFEAAAANLAKHTDQVLLDLEQFLEPASRETGFSDAVRPVVSRMNGHDFFLDPAFDRLNMLPSAFLFKKQAVPWREMAGEYEIRMITFAQEKRKYHQKIRKQQSTWDQFQQSTLVKLLSRYFSFENKIFPRSKPITDLFKWVITFFLRAYRWLRTASGRLWNYLLRFSIRPLPSSFEETYRRWIKQNSPGEEVLAKQKMLANQFESRPLVSFITPVFNPPQDVLADTIRSVIAQTYPNWELCLADGGTDESVRQLLRKSAEADERIRVCFLDENRGISGNSNAAIEMAGGEFIAILDHDDVLAPDMLFEVVSRLNEKPETDIIFFDEDKLSADGTQRRDPFFKPDWSPEMLISANYLTHAVYRRRLLDEIGWFDPETDGAQDWDLAFRAVEHTQAVEHIPKILYHWRQIGGSTAGQFRAKEWVFENQKKTVLGHLRRLGLAEAEVNFDGPGRLRLRWPHQGRRVSIVIPTRDKVDYLQRTVESIRRKTIYPDYEIVLVDNQSEEPATHAYYEQLRSDRRIRFVNFNEEFNYSRANNLGAAVASGDFLLFLNNDIEILEPDWLDELARWAELPEIGAVGTKLLFPDGTIQHAGVVLGMEGHASHVFYGAHEHHGGIFGSVNWYRNFMAVTGACVMIPTRVFDQVGGFDEKYVLAFSDIEICLRIHLEGFRVLYTPFARIRHFEGQSRGSRIPLDDIRHGVHDFLPWVRRGDPYFNPNLSHTLRMPSLAAPGEADPVSRLKKMA